MLFDKVTKEHIIQGIEDFKEKGIPEGFSWSITYDLLHEEEGYPPKIIMAYANYHATGRKIENYFKGGEKTECFKTFEKLGFEIIKKDEFKNTLFFSEEEIIECKKNKIGIFVSSTLPYIIENKLVSKNTLEQLQDFHFSTDNFKGMRFSILKKVDNSKSLTENRDVRGSSRYYKTPAKTINGDFLITSEWYKQSFDGYIKFLTTKVKNDEKLKKNILKMIQPIESTFFTQEEFELLKNTSGVKYYPKTTELTRSYNDLKIAYLKVEKWLKWVQSTLFTSAETHLVKRPTNQANKFDGYLWGKIYPTKEDHKNKWLAITLGLEDDYYCIKVDTVGLGEKDKLRQHYLKKRGDYYNSKMVKLHPKEKINNWEELYNQTENDIKELMNYFNDIKAMESTNQVNSNINDSIPLNQILYGPPGTGKTYTLSKEYFSKYITKETSLTKEQYFESIVKDCSWWQVIAIALLELGKSKVSEIYDNKWVQQKAKLSNSKTVRPTLWGQLQSHTIDNCEFVNVKKRQDPLIFNKDENSLWEVLNNEVKELSPEIFDIINKVENFTPNADNEIKRYKFVTFHQSFSYEDFIEGIKPVLPIGEDIASDLGYKVENGVFKELCIDAKNDPNNQYAIFIDEINRGNVSAIFGELITLIETDKRIGCDNEISIILPYSKEEFSIPKNIDIYGTMNTADRSVEALDTALRRRFSFVEMMPNYEVIANKNIDGINLKKLLKTINKRVEVLIDRDHMIGHSYFININNTEELANTFNDKIIPLLQEYFYGDYGKIGLVLGKGFVEKEDTEKIKFADFNYDDSDDFKTPKYELKKSTKENIIPALNILLGGKDASSD